MISMENILLLIAFCFCALCAVLSFIPTLFSHGGKLKYLMWFMSTAIVVYDVGRMISFWFCRGLSIYMYTVTAVLKLN